MELDNSCSDCGDESEVRYSRLQTEEETIVDDDELICLICLSERLNGVRDGNIEA